jgi:hypothetical protein
MDKSSNQNVIESMSQAGLASARVVFDALQEITGIVSANNPLLALQNRSCCDIPPACWLPRQFGTVESRACPCGTALLRLKVSNCRPARSEIEVRAKTDAKLEIKVTPGRATLDPMESRHFTVVAHIPEDACRGESYDLIVWVSGCNDHFARWNVIVGDGASGTCQILEVEDCPDYVHHWYDHFYCNQPCFSRSRKRST